MGIRVITVSRQFGSGGRTIAKETAERLGWAYYDKELVKKIAAESGLAESYILESGEYACSTSSFLFNWVMNAEGARSGSLPISDQLYIIQHNIIKDLAEKERCVIVGRCADYVLRDRPDCLHTFFHADTASGPTASSAFTASGPKSPRSASKRRTTSAAPITATTPATSGASPRTTISASTPAGSA